MKATEKIAIVYVLLMAAGAVSAQMMGYGEGGYGMMGAPGYGFVPNTSYYQGYQAYPYGYGGMPMGMMPMMGGYGGGMMGAYPGVMFGGWFLLLILIAAVVVVVYYARGREAPSSAKDILDMRLAKGEITLEEYRKLREVIEE